MLLLIQNMRGNASPRGIGTDAPAVIARRGQLSRNYKTFASAALDPHPAVHNPLLPFGNVAQTVIDGLAMLSAFLLVSTVGLGLLFALFVALFVKL